MPKRHSSTLSSGANNTVIALTEQEVGKLFQGDTRSDIGSEAEKMRASNAINDLVVKFIRLDVNEELDVDMLRDGASLSYEFSCVRTATPVAVAQCV